MDQPEIVEKKPVIRRADLPKIASAEEQLQALESMYDQVFRNSLVGGEPPQLRLSLGFDHVDFARDSGIAILKREINTLLDYLKSFGVRI